MNFDDEQLDKLLGDIEVPESLQQNLREIPQLRDTEVVNSHEASTGIGWIGMLAIAASLLLLMSLINLSIKDANVDRDPTTIADNNDDTESSEDNIDVASDGDLDTKLLEMRLQSVDLVLMQQKTKRMQRKLEELKRSQLPALDSSEQQSIVLSMSCQSAIEMGASLETFREELEQIKLEYPNLKGSEIASRLLEPQESHN